MGDEAYGASSAKNSEATSASSGWTTTKQAAKVLGVSRRSVQGYVRRGLLEAREEGDGVGKTFYVSIDSLNALRNRRTGEAYSSGEYAVYSPQSSDAANPTEKSGESLRHVIDRLEARTVEATELRMRLELTEKAQSTLEEQLAEERRLREEAERERDELRQRLESALAPPRAPESAPDLLEDAEPPPHTAVAQEGTREPEVGEERDPNIRAEDYGESPSRPSWWRWIFGGGS